MLSGDEEIEISNPNHDLELVYIGDFVHKIMLIIECKKEKSDDHYYQVALSYKVSSGEVADIIKRFKQSRETRFIPNLNDD